MITFQSTALLLAISGAQFAADGSLFAETGVSCSITKAVTSSDGKFTIMLMESLRGRTITVQSAAWTNPQKPRLPYMGLKAGRTVLSDRALSTSGFGSGFGSGLIFKVATDREELTNIVSKNTLVIWDLRGPRKLVSVNLALSATTLERWRNCAVALKRATVSDPFR